MQFDARTVLHSDPGEGRNSSGTNVVCSSSPGLSQLRLPPGRAVPQVRFRILKGDAQYSVTALPFLYASGLNNQRVTLLLDVEEVG